MKRLLMGLTCILFLFSFYGCATTKITTDIGTSIGKTYQEAAAKGTISAEQSIKAWPYVSGNIKGLLAYNYENDVPDSMKDIITKLDELSSKDSLTDEEKGFVLGSFVRLESMAMKMGWEKMGVDIYNWVIGF